LTKLMLGNCAFLEDRFWLNMSETNKQMTGQTKAILVVVILGAGLLLALPFARSGAHPEGQQTDVIDGELWLKKTAWGESDAPVEAQTDAKVAEMNQRLNATPGSGSTALMSSSLLNPNPPAPEPADIQMQQVIPRPQGLEQDHQNARARLGQNLTRIPDDVVPITPTLNAQNLQPQARVSNPRPATPTTGDPKVVKHLVRDGDTLQTLAARYLKDSRRAYEIYQSNREILGELLALPVGEELVIVVD
jgi:nucleoid-associated protein YgaU